MAKHSAVAIVDVEQRAQHDPPERAAEHLAEHVAERLELPVEWVPARLGPGEDLVEAAEGHRGDGVERDEEEGHQPAVPGSVSVPHRAAPPRPRITRLLAQPGSGGARGGAPRPPLGSGRIRLCRSGQCRPGCGRRPLHQARPNGESERSERTSEVEATSRL